ncbi:MAG: acetate kinase [Phycisphaerae bacterium]|jgi:acetate kinase
MKILVINCGSSSIKFKLFDMARDAQLASGLIERVGERHSRSVVNVNGHSHTSDEPIADYDQGVREILRSLTTIGDPPPLQSTDEVGGVGHRVVHGGETFCESAVVDAEVLAAIEKCCELAPLHNPANLAGLRAAAAALPGCPHVAVFDTAYFQTMPPAAYLYPVPHEWYVERRIRRYGFHGTSHRYVALRAAELLGKPTPNLITLHLGNGCSAACIRAGVAIDQSMGLTPLEGLMMGTRSGDIDPAIIFHLERSGVPLEEIRTTLEKRSGLLGLSGVSRDLRDVERAAEQGSVRARLALDVFAHRARKYIGAFLSELPQCDAIVLTGGIGENSVMMRRMILEGLTVLGVSLDPQRNDRRGPEPFCITRAQSRVSAWVIPTNEELLIARDTAELVQRGAGRGRRAETLAGTPHGA